MALPKAYGGIAAALHAVFDRDREVAVAGRERILPREGDVLHCDYVRGPSHLRARCGEVLESTGALGSAISRENHPARIRTGTSCAHSALRPENGGAKIA